MNEEFYEIEPVSDSSLSQSMSEENEKKIKDKCEEE